MSPPSAATVSPPRDAIRPPMRLPLLAVAALVFLIAPVLVIILRVLYWVWYCFLALFILQYAMLIQRCRAVLYEKINPKNELVEDDDDE